MGNAKIVTAIILAAILFIWLLYLVVKSSLCKDAKEFDDCQKEFNHIRVGITNYFTTEGAKARCEYLYKKHNVNAEITIVFSNEPELKTNAVEYFKLTK